MKFNGKVLKELRKGRKLSLEKLAREIECSYPKIWQIEREKINPNFRDVQKMVKVFNLPDARELIIF